MERLRKILFTRQSVPNQLVYVFVFTLLALLKNFSWFLDLFSHFHLQYFLLACGYLIYFIYKLGRQKTEALNENEPRRNYTRWVMLAAITLVVNLVVILPVYQNLYQLNTSPPDLKDAQKISLLLSNVFVKNNNTQAVVEMVNSYDADIVALQEIWGSWPERIKKTDLKRRYPYQSFDSSRGNLILSKLPIISTRILSDDKHLGDSHDRLNLSILDFLIQLPNGENVRFINMHPSVPISVFAPKNQQYMTLVNQIAKEETMPLIVYGDFNTTVFSGFYQTLMANSGLYNARKGFGFKPTWPSVFPPFWIGIDHVLLSEHFTATAFQTGPFVWSDHLPVYVELAIKN